MGDKLHLKLNTNEIPIAYKYREGKLKRTLKRELKGTEIAEREVESIQRFSKSRDAWILIFMCVMYVDFAVTLGEVDCTS